jgi:branched-chain amino acid aminotransferase
MGVSLLPFTWKVLILTRSQGYELVTPPLDGMILPGVTRDSVLSLAREHSSRSNRLSGLPDDLTISERSVTMREVKESSESGKLVELFGAGMVHLHLLPFSL